MSLFPLAVRDTRTAWYGWLFVSTEHMKNPCNNVMMLLCCVEGVSCDDMQMQQTNLQFDKVAVDDGKRA